MIDLNRLKLLTGSRLQGPICLEYSLIHSFITGYFFPCLLRIFSTKLSCAVAHRASWNGRCTQHAQNSDISCSERVRVLLPMRMLLDIWGAFDTKGLLLQVTLRCLVLCWLGLKRFSRICRRGIPKFLILTVEGSCFTWKIVIQNFLKISYINYNHSNQIARISLYLS